MTVTHRVTLEVAPFMPVLEVFEILGIHSNTGYRRMREDEFPLEVIPIGKRYFCRRSDVEALVKGDRRSA